GSGPRPAGGAGRGTRRPRRRCSAEDPRLVGWRRGAGRRDRLQMDAGHRVVALLAALTWATGAALPARGMLGLASGLVLGAFRPRLGAFRPRLGVVRPFPGSARRVPGLAPRGRRRALLRIRVRAG